MTFQFFTPDEKPYGFTYGQWTVKWWQWLLGIAKDDNPALDDTGKNTAVEQNNPNTWFLAGTFVGAKVPHRICRLPAGKAILFPTINYQANFLEDPIFPGESELKKHVYHDINDIAYNLAVLDGVNMPIYRVGSDPTLFPVRIAKGIPHGTNGNDEPILSVDDGLTNAVSDGYWVFLKPLPSGRHDLHLAGACTGGKRRTEAYYHLTIEDAP